MKYILLLLMTFVFIQKIKGIKSLFKSTKRMQEDLSKAFSVAEEKLGGTYGREALLGIAIIITTIGNLLYLLFYNLAMVYVGEIWFVVFSIIQICFTFRFIFKTINEIPKYEDPDYFRKPNRFAEFLNILFEFLYIGYLLYFIIVNWV